MKKRWLWMHSILSLTKNFKHVYTQAGVGKIATHSSILAWKIPLIEGPGGLWFMGLQRVRHN